MIPEERGRIDTHEPFAKYYRTAFRYICKCCFFSSGYSSFKVFQKDYLSYHNRRIFFDVAAMYLFSRSVLFRDSSLVTGNDVSLYILDYYHGHTIFSLFYTFKKRLAEKHDVICYLGYYHCFTSFFKCSHYSNIPAEYTALWIDRNLMYGNISISCSFSPAAYPSSEHALSG